MERHIGNAAEPLWAFVDAEINPDAMPCAVIEILSGEPEGIARDCVEIAACEPFGETQPRDCNHALQDTRKAALFFGSDSADRQCARDVGCAVNILSAAVQTRVAGLL